jgi:hypothetical protein
MSPKPKDLETISAQIAEQERVYDWLGASESHQKALSLIGKHDFSALGEKYEQMGYARYRAAMQAKNQEEFKERMQEAVRACEVAHGLYDQLEGKQKARTYRCEAISKYFGCWLSPSPDEKRKLLDECLNLEEKALAAFLGSGNHTDYVSTFNVLALAICFRSFLEWNRQTLKSMLEKGITRAEKAVELVAKNGGSYETGRAFLGLGLVRVCDFLGDYFVEDPQNQEQLRLKTIEDFRRAIEFSEKANDAYSLSLSYYWLGLYSGAQECLVQKSLEYGEEAHDHYMQGSALDLLAYIMFWKCTATEHPDRTRDLAEKAMRFYDRAQCHFNIISYQSPRWGALPAPAGYAEYYLGWAELETDQQKKIGLLAMSEKLGIEALKVAEDSGIPLIIDSVLHVVSKTLAARAILEQDSDVKRSLLERALKHRERAIEIAEKLTPYDYWDLGVELSGLAKINAQLSSLEKDFDNKKNLLEDAIAQSEKSLKLAGKIMPYYEEMGRLELYSSLYRMQDSHATMLTELYELTKDLNCLGKAIVTSQKAIESAEKIEIVNHVAESHWKIARIQDIIGEHLKAAEDFQQASISYRKASDKIPQLKAFYTDYASYMEAWSQIEKARQHHVRQEYGMAKEYYEKAAEIHKSLKQWSYLTPNYLAWSTLENAEDLSRKEKNEQAIQSFERATKIFGESNATLKDAAAQIENPDEKQLADDLTKATEIRQEYCVGRIVLEEAKILDKKGDHLLSSEKFGDASKIFKEIARSLKNEQERKDLGLIATLAEAWQKMTQAETEMSPALYAEASQLFQQAKDLGSDEKTKMLTMGHHHFCKALEAGTKFVDTRDMAIWNTAIQELDTAGNYYTKAGFESASEFTKATGLLFDAYVYIDKAKKETDPETKTKLYIMTEKVLEASADHFEKAEHTEKRTQARALMKEIEKEKEFALSLAEVLHNPLIGSTTSFPVPSPTLESAVGSERFEHADIQANLKALEDIELGEQFDVLLDLVNIGNNHGLLVRLDHIAPSGTKVASITPQYDVENSSVNLKGKKIDPLKLESIKIKLQATRTGVVSLKPHVIYVDDRGQFRTSQPEPVSVSVHAKIRFEFRTKEAEKIFDYLVGSFVDDYMKRKISLEKSGWRTLNEIVTHGRVHKSSVYGVRGRRGRDMSELERRGIVESRIFPGERGRGGNIWKVRIPYDKEIIKRHVDERVMKSREK